MNILIVRMQCAEFPYRKFRSAMIDMIKHDRLSMFYKGLVPIFGGQAWLLGFMALAFYFEEKQTKYLPLIAGSLFLTGALIGHPMYLVGMRVQYG